MSATRLLSVPAPTTASPALTPARAVAVVTPAVVLVIGTVAAINLAIPTLQGSDLRPSSSATAWIVDSYTLVFACLLIPAGALGDRFGRRRGMLLGLGAFAAGSAISALAPSIAVLLVGRALCGVGAAFVLPATLAVSLARLAPPDRPQAIALWSALTGAGGALGNLGGGLAVDLGGWRTLFWACVPIALGAATLIAARVPDQAPHRDPVDPGGGLLLTAGSVALLYGVIDAPELGWASVRVLGAIALGLVLIAAFVGYELRRPQPMLDPRLFRLTGVRAGALGILALFFVLFGLFYVNAQYLQDVKGLSPLLTGVCVLPVAVVMPFVGARSMRISQRVGARATVAAGMLALATGLGLISFATAATPYPLYGSMLALVSAGMGLAMPPLSALMVEALPPSRAGVGAGLNSTTRELGSALGVAVFSTLLATRFADRLPAALSRLPGGGEDAGRSVAAALHAAGTADPSARARLLDGTRDAFTSGTALGLRVGVALLLLTTLLVVSRPFTAQRKEAP